MALLTTVLLFPATWSQAPPNDALLNATPITGTTNRVTGTNVGATKETGEPNHANDAGGKSVWWSWTAPADGIVTLDTIGSSFDTLLAVYTGDTVTNLWLVASNDDIGSQNLASVVAFSAVGGTTYKIAVDGCRGDSGNIALDLWQGPLPPQITAQPQNFAAVAGQALMLNVTATGATPLRYQWVKNDQLLDGATNGSFSISAAQTNDAGVYHVIVTNTIGRVVSSNLVLTVTPIVMQLQPQDLTIATGYPAHFGVVAASYGSPTYQWFKDGSPIAGAISASFTITNTQFGDAGAYSVVVNLGDYSVTSPNAVFTVVPSYTFITFAGLKGVTGTNDGVGDTARFAYPHGLAVDAADNIYVTEIANEAVRKITPDGMVSTVAHLRPVMRNYDPFEGPWGIAVDRSTNLYVADPGSQTILKITPDGVVQTLAGTTGVAGMVDGPGSTARFDIPSGLVVTESGIVYVADWGNQRIRALAPDGMTSSLAGGDPGGFSGSKNGRWTKAQFHYPSGLGLDASGDLYIADEGNNELRKITPDGTVTTLAGSGKYGWQDGAGSSAAFAGPHGGAVDAAGNVYVVGSDDCTLRRITPAGMVTTLAGGPMSPDSLDGAGPAARFYYPRWVAVDSLGDLYVTDMEKHVIRKGVPFAIATWPQNQTVLAGTNLSLTTVAAGDGPFAYQWQFAGTPLAGQTNSTLILGPVSRSDSGVYSVMVSNTNGNWITLNVTVRVIVPPVIQPPQVAADGTARLLFQDADGGVPSDFSQVSLQWRTNLPSGSDTHWQSITAGFYVTNGFVVFDDTNALNRPVSFYRIQEK
jgi:hypothetical protein